MKTLWIFCCLLSLANSQTNTYTFIGRFEKYDFEDLCSWSKFVGRSSESKTFYQCEYWDGPKFDFQDEYRLQYKWFEVKYYGVFDYLEDEGKKQWLRRIKSVKMIHPRIPNIIRKENSQLRFFTCDNGQFIFEFYEYGERNPYTVQCDSSQLQKLPFNFSDMGGFEKQYAQKWFSVVFSADYQLNAEAPAARRLRALKLLDQ